MTWKTLGFPIILKLMKNAKYYSDCFKFSKPLKSSSVRNLNPSCILATLICMYCKNKSNKIKHFGNAGLW